MATPGRQLEAVSRNVGLHNEFNRGATSGTIIHAQEYRDPNAVTAVEMGMNMAGMI